MQYVYYEIWFQINDQNDPGFDLCQWRVEKGSAGIPDSRGAYITYVMGVLYIWTGHDFSGTKEDNDIDSQTVRM